MGLDFQKIECSVDRILGQCSTDFSSELCWLVDLTQGMVIRDEASIKKMPP